MSPASSGKVSTSHTDKAFESDLRLVREKLLAMGAKVEEQIAKCMRSLTDRDSELGEQVKKALDSFVRADPEEAQEVLAGDDHLDDLFVKIFNELLAFMMEDSRNIRRATSLVSICKHLERIGDHAVNVAEMVIYMVRGTDVRHPRSRAVES